MDHRELIKQYELATNSHQFERVEDLLTDDAVFWYAKTKHVGKEQIRRYFENSWTLLVDEVYTIKDMVWITESVDSAVCLYTYHWKGIYQGDITEGTGRGTNVLIKIGEKWKICHEHLSAD